jgi:hypothetical protein
MKHMITRTLILSADDAAYYGVKRLTSTASGLVEIVYNDGHTSLVCSNKVPLKMETLTAFLRPKQIDNN